MRPDVKKLFAALMTGVAIVASCAKFDDSKIWEELERQKSELTSQAEKIAKIEQRLNEMNSNIASLQTVVTALQNNDFVTGVAEITLGDKVIGYIITFSKSGSVTIYHGKDGENGSDGNTPVIGVKKDTDDQYYWTVDGEWLLDNSGAKVRVTGEKGDNGTNGITPKLRINSSTNYWEVSYNNGSTWTSLNVKATGPQGEQGEPGDGIFRDIQVNEDDATVTIVLTDGTVIIIPIGTEGELIVPKPVDLSINGTANCYIVSAEGKYVFPTVKGNSSVSIEQIASAEVLWESFGTIEVPRVGSLVRDIAYTQGEISFYATNAKGNAVIAAKDADGNILWSWHIWLTDQPEDQVYINNAGTMMDRNLGATSATPGEVSALGLFYQWGRKDPFLGSASISDDTRAVSTNNSSWAVTASTESEGTIEYAVAHPVTFLTRNGLNNDWHYTGSTSTDNTRWASAKTIYDPCPAGYRVPDGGQGGVWETAFGSRGGFTDGTFDSTNMGHNFAFSKSAKYLTLESSCWYPAAGYLYLIDGLKYSTYGYYWSCTPNKTFTRAILLNFDMSGVVGTSSTVSAFAYGHSVRCLKES